MSPLTAPLASPVEAARRRELLREPHMAPLAAFVNRMRATDRLVPDLDPLDGGTGARLLLLLEKPGPGTALDRGGSGFVSFDNRGPTAASGRRFLQEAGIDRAGLAIWNLCPWWNGTIRFTAAERRAGLAVVPPFLDLMPSLRAAVCVGRQAERARPLLEERGLAVFASAHPSGQVRAASRARWDAVPGTWAQAWAVAGGTAEAGPG